MNGPHGAVEILDATDPAVTRRVSRMVWEGPLGMSTVSFWYLCAELVLLVAVLCFLVLHLSWFAAVAVAIPGGYVAHVAVLLTKLKLRVGIKPGDQWYVLEGPGERAVVLVKTRAGKRFVADAAADSSELSRHLRDFFEDRASGGDYFLTPGLGT